MSRRGMVFGFGRFPGTETLYRKREGKTRQFRTFALLDLSAGHRGSFFVMVHPMPSEFATVMIHPMPSEFATCHENFAGRHFCRSSPFDMMQPCASCRAECALWMIRYREGTNGCLPAAGIQEFLQHNSLKRVVPPESWMPVVRMCP